MKKIEIPKEIDVNEIEKLILENYPDINLQVKNLSLQWTERILLFLNEIRRGLNYNEYKFLEGELEESELPYVQVCDKKREKLLAENSDYTEVIRKKVLYKYVQVRMYDDTLEFYKKGYSCKQYKFINQPLEYKEYELQTIVNNKVKKLREVELSSDILSKEEQTLRRCIVANTDKLFLLNNYSSRAILGKQLKKVRQTPSGYIERFNSNDSNVVICDSYGRRLHSKITNLKGKLHQHLRVDGVTPITWDIKNSQPYFSSILTSEVIDNLVEINPRIEYLLKVKPVVAKYENDVNYLEYRKRCVSGRVYEYLCDVYKDLYGESITRKDIKQSIFIAMFSNYSNHEKNGYYQRTEIKRCINVFRTAFPSVYEFFMEVQTIDLQQAKLDVNGEQESHKNVSYIMQQVESTVMLGVVAKKLYELNQQGISIYFTFIHDAVMTIPSTSELVKNVILESINKLGIEPPQLDVK